MLLAGGDHREFRQVPIVIQHHVDFHSGFGTLKVCPVEDVYAQPNRRGVQRYQLNCENEICDPETPPAGIAPRVHKTRLGKPPRGDARWRRPVYSSWVHPAGPNALASLRMPPNLGKFHVANGLAPTDRTSWPRTGPSN